MSSVIKVKQRFDIMEQTIQNTLKRWESSLVNYGKVDQWNINEDYSILGAFIAGGGSKAARSAVRECRDYSISGSCDATVLLSMVRNANRILNKPYDDRINRELKKLNSIGQAKRYVSTTKKLYGEKLRFKGGQYLKDIDISMEDGATSRKVRRIVEKRMCQAYHRQHKQLTRNDGQDRHYMKRATSFQLHNLGQIECESGVCRSQSTHWKKTYDPITGEVVFKKKMAYSSYEEAAEAARQYMMRHPEETVPMTAYRCAFCGKWHIGHSTPDEIKTYPEMVTFLGMAS